MDGGQLAVPPQGQMQVRDVTEAHERLGVGPDGPEVEVTRDAVGTRTAPCSDDCAHPWIAEGVIEVIEAMLISPSHVAPVIERVVSHLNAEIFPCPPAGEWTSEQRGSGPIRGHDARRARP